MDNTLPVAQIPAGAARRAANRGFVWVVGVSLVLHGGIIGGVILAQALKPARPPPTRAIPVELVRLGKKRDPALLPRKVAPDYAPPPAPDAVSLDTGNKSTPNKKDKTAPKQMSDAAKRLLEGADNRLDKALSKIEEPEGDPDGDPMGTTTDAANAAQGYAAAILRTLKGNYKLPDTIPAGQRQFLKARVVLYVERDGRIRDFQFIEEHPNKLFMGALETMLKTLQLPAPPKDIEAAMRETGVEVIFKP